MVCEAPNYPSNYGIPEGLGMEYSLCHMKFEDDYRLDMDAIKAMVTDKTKVLSICHPNNPTGCTLTEPELHEILGIMASTEEDVTNAKAVQEDNMRLISQQMALLHESMTIMIQNLGAAHSANPALQAQ